MYYGNYTVPNTVGNFRNSESSNLTYQNKLDISLQVSLFNHLCYVAISVIDYR